MAGYNIKPNRKRFIQESEDFVLKYGGVLVEDSDEFRRFEIELKNNSLIITIDNEREHQHQYIVYMKYKTKPKNSSQECNFLGQQTHINGLNHLIYGFSVMLENAISDY